MGKQRKVTRRRFIGDAAIGAAGVAVALNSGSVLVAAQELAKSKSNIRNYNPDMEYRRLGRTGLMVSAVALGGHWKRMDVMRQGLDENRRQVINRCIEVGINYVDACTGVEFTTYSKVLSVVGREKVYLGLSHAEQEPRKEAYRTKNKLLESLDSALRDARQEYADLWRMTCMETGSRHSYESSCEIVAALEKAKKQGKARFVGISSHDRRWLKFMIEYFPQIEVVLFPYTANSKVLPTDSIFEALKKQDMGALGIKPFSSNSIFKGSSAPQEPTAEEDSRTARMVIRCILGNPHIIPIPGLISPAQVDNVARAVKEHRQLDATEAQELSMRMEQAWASLPANYQWLKNWEYV